MEKLILFTCMAMCVYCTGDVSMQDQLAPIFTKLNHRLELVIELTDRQSKTTQTQMALDLTSSNATIAVNAAWHRVSRSFDKPWAPTDPGIPITREALFRFLGFLEGRLRMQVPQFWADTLLTGKYRSKLRVVFDDSMLEDRTETLTPSKPRQLNGGLEFPSLTHIYRVPNSETDGELPGIENTATILEREADAFVMLQDSIDPGCELFRFERKSGKLIWKTNVWGEPTFNGSGRLTPHRIELVVDNDRVSVFGARVGNLYIETFSLNEGKPLLRFGTCYVRYVDSKILETANVKMSE